MTKSATPYYGWVIVGAAFLVLAISYGMIFSYGVYLPELQKSLGEGAAIATLPFSCCVAVYCTLSLVTGRIVDAVGPRPVVIAGAALLAIGFWGMSVAWESWHVFVAFGLVTGAGMSAAYIPMTSTVVKWFEARRGLALGIASQGLSASTVIGPVITAAMIAALGWRDAALAIGLGGSAFIALCGLTLRREPRSGSGNRASNAAVEGTELTGYSLKQACKTRPFWLLVVLFWLSWCVLFFPYAHLPNLAADHGYDPISAAALLGAMGVGGAAGRIVFGPLSDRIGRQRAVQLAILFQIVACTILPSTGEYWLLYAAAALFGSGSGAAITLFPAIVGDLFGPRHVGAISGLIFALTGSAGALGPYAAAAIREATGSFDLAFWIGAGFNTVSLFLVFALTRPRQLVEPAAGTA